MNPNEKPLFVWNDVTLSTPPLSVAARRELGFLVGLLQTGERLSLPHSRPMPRIGAGVHELRVREANANWRLIYRVDKDKIVIVRLFRKTTEETPQDEIVLCQSRFRDYDAAKNDSAKNNP